MMKKITVEKCNNGYLIWWITATGAVQKFVSTTPLDAFTRIFAELDDESPPQPTKEMINVRSIKPAKINGPEGGTEH